MTPRLPEDAYERLLPIWTDPTMSRREKEAAAYKALWGVSFGADIAIRLALLLGASGIVVGAFEAIKALWL